VKAFSALYTELDETNRTGAKIAALRRYFTSAPPADAAWAVHFLIGRRPKRLIEWRMLASLAIEASGVPDWLFSECFHATGDFAETIALLLAPARSASEGPLHEWVEQRLLPLRTADDITKSQALLSAWLEMDERQRFVWTKLITGEFRVGVSQSLVVRALAEAGGFEEAVIAHRLMGDWEPSPGFFAQLMAREAGPAEVSRPYPFFLAYPLEVLPESLGPIGDWQVEWKWDGIRAQMIRRAGETWLWSRGEELVTDRFPEAVAGGSQLPEGTVLDGELLAWKDGAPLPFTAMQRRIGRKQPGARILAEAPVAMLVFDLLEWRGEDVRERPLEWRRARLEESVAAPALVLSPLVAAIDWADLARQREESRGRGVEGFMLKRRDSPYRAGRRRGDWWKWKIDPYSVDCVLIMARPGNGRRASLFTDYTFGVWDAGELTPFAKAYSGLTDEEIREVDAFVRANTVAQFGPVRQVKPELVFELAFEAIQPSTRHRSGIAVRFPRMARWRRDKKPDDADTLETLRALLRGGTGRPL